MIWSLAAALGLAALPCATLPLPAQNPAGGRGGGRGGAARRPAIQVMTLTSDWKDGGVIPQKHSQPGRDVSPALSWSAAPAGTASFVLLVHDVDSPLGNGLDDVLHWLVWDIPASATSLPEGIPADANLPDGSRQISISGPYYRGPAAPASGPVHHYMFELFALDTVVSVPAVGAPPAATRAAVAMAMGGHIRGKATLVGVYRRPD
jgi:Raf kinase inhibitor-like YbhB/YbcL family protein